MSPQAVSARSGAGRCWSLWSRLRLLLVGVLVAFAALTVGFQVLDPFGYAVREDAEQFSASVLERRDGRLRLRPGAVGTYLGTRVTIGAHGLRNPPIPEPKPAGRYRILVIGDSVPFGWGVDEEDAFPRQVERALQALAGPGRTIEVVNGASPGWGLPEELWWLEQEGLAFAPDLVVHCVIANDVEVPGPPRAFVLPDWARGVRLFRLAELAWDRMTSPPQPPPPPGEMVAAMLPAVLAWFQARCTAAGARYVLLDTLTVPETEAMAERAQIARIAVPCGQDFIDRYHVSAGDAHPNRDGHADMTRRMLPRLVEILRDADPGLLVEPGR